MPASPFVFRDLAVTFALLGLAGATSAGCTDATAPCEDVNGNACVSTAGETRFDGASALTGGAVYSGKPIAIENANGSLIVTGAPGTAISVQTTPFAFAANQADADAALADMAILIDETSMPGNIHVQCKQPSSAHGSAEANTTGCDKMTVTVPAGAIDAPVALRVTGHNGDTSISGVIGQAIAHSDLGDTVVSVTPTTGMAVESSCDNGDATLTLPSDFAADQIRIEVDNGTFDTTFSDITTATTSRGTEGTGASSVILSSQNGDVHLVSSF